MLIAMSYYNKRTQSRISKDKKLKGQSPEETRHKLPEPSPRGITQDALDLSSYICDNTCEMASTTEAHWTFSAQGFYWGLDT